MKGEEDNSHFGSKFKQTQNSNFTIDKRRCFCDSESFDLEFWLRKCLRHKWVLKVSLWNYCDLEQWLRMGLEYN